MISPIDTVEGREYFGHELLGVSNKNHFFHSAVVPLKIRKIYVQNLLRFKANPQNLLALLGDELLEY